MSRHCKIPGVFSDAAEWAITILVDLLWKNAPMLVMVLETRKKVYCLLLWLDHFSFQSTGVHWMYVVVIRRIFDKTEQFTIRHISSSM
jgi:hypothetical protein